MYLIIGMILTSLNSFAVDWSELEVNQGYKLVQNLTLKQDERSSSMIELMKGEPFTLADITPLEMINVTMFGFQYQNCPGREMTSQMEIIKVEGTEPYVEVGALLERECVLEIYIENKDLLTKSLFN